MRVVSCLDVYVCVLCGVRGKECEVSVGRSVGVGEGVGVSIGEVGVCIGEGVGI